MNRYAMLRSGRLLVALLLLSIPAPGAAQDNGEAPTVIFLVRHAEKALDPDATGDPALTPMGRERATRLASLLADTELTSVLSTGYRRTMETARPAADDAELEVQRYDPTDLDGLAARLRATAGAHLVVGHSNTTPTLVAALGGDPGEPIEESEYDRLYILFPEPDGTARTVLLRF